MNDFHPAGPKAAAPGLPPLPPLVAFEAAARIGSFQKAAEELNITPSAVSHRIRKLEMHVGAPLFDRGEREVRPTKAGMSLLPYVEQALENLRRGMATLQAPADPNRLTISAAPSLAVGWLMPRLSAFQLSAPHIHVRLESTTRLVDLQDSDVDVALRYCCREEDIAEHRDWLFDEALTPVCTPKYADDFGGLDDPARLGEATLIYATARTGQWSAWMRAQGVAQHENSARGLYFENDALAVEAALMDLGVAIATPDTVAHHLSAGRLIAPFDGRPVSDYGFYFICLPERLEHPAIATFRHWILEEARKVTHTPV